MSKLTKAQLRFLQRLKEDDFGASRHMRGHERRVGYNLKDKGLVALDGVISSSITEGSQTYDGMTFVLTDLGRSALSEQREEQE